MSKAEVAPPNQAEATRNGKGAVDRTCGIVMPIADSPNYASGHWADVFAILSQAIRDAGFEPKMVSSEDAVGVIQHRIVQNLYNNPIVVADVSNKNPNVMFELGMRLAFDKPTVIIKDDLTSYNFDVGPIEHVAYRSDLHYHSMISFQAELSSKVKSTFEASASGSSSSFLKSFGNIAPAQLGEVSQLSLVLEELTNIRQELLVARRRESATAFKVPATFTPVSPQERLSVSFPEQTDVESRIFVRDVLLARYGLEFLGETLAGSGARMEFTGSREAIAKGLTFVRKERPDLVVRITS